MLGAFQAFHFNDDHLCSEEGWRDVALFKGHREIESHLCVIKKPLCTYVCEEMALLQEPNLSDC